MRAGHYLLPVGSALTPEKAGASEYPAAGQLGHHLGTVEPDLVLHAVAAPGAGCGTLQRWAATLHLR